MRNRIVLLAFAVLLLFTTILLLLPTSYQITVRNSLYYANCSPHNGSRDPCKTIDPPVVITKREPYIFAWWNNTQIERGFSLNEVTTQWSNSNEDVYRKAGTGILKVLVSLLSLLILALPIFTLIKASKLKGTEKIAWICLILFTFPIGSIIFVIAKPKEK